MIHEREGEGHVAMVDEHDVVASGERGTIVLQRLGIPITLIVSC